MNVIKQPSVSLLRAIRRSTSDLRLSCQADPLINLKGGVGKSTIAALLARHAYRTHDLDVLAIDLDPQANLSQGLMHSDYSEF